MSVSDVADVDGDKVFAETMGPLLGNKDEIRGEGSSTTFLFLQI
jgi:hypothetical protein